MSINKESGDNIFPLVALATKLDTIAYYFACSQERVGRLPLSRFFLNCGSVGYPRSWQTAGTKTFALH